MVQNNEILDYELEVGSFEFKLDLEELENKWKMTGITKEGQIVRVHIITKIGIDEATRVKEMMRQLGFLPSEDV